MASPSSIFKGWKRDLVNGRLNYVYDNTTVGYINASTHVVNQTLDVDAAATFSSGITVSGSSTLGTTTLAGNLTVSGTATISGAATFSSGVTAAGALTVSGAARFTGATTIVSGTIVSGVASFNSGVSMAGALIVSGASSFTSSVTSDGAMNVDGQFTYSDRVAHVSESTLDITSSRALGVTDSGKVLTISTDALIISLAATTLGHNFTFVNMGSDAAVALRVSPNSSDSIMGCGLSGVDDKDIINTKSTAKTGDMIHIIGDELK
jgi:autotransporter-associated beta strand protein